MLFNEKFTPKRKKKKIIKNKLEKIQCYECGEYFPVKNMYFGNDQYHEEINKIEEYTELCEKCYLENLRDI